MGFFGTSETSSKFKTKKVKEEGCLVTLQVEIPTSKVQEATHNTLVRLQAQARLPGFRPGKAPLEVVQKQLSHYAQERVVDELIREALPDVLREHALQPIATPTVSSIQADAGKPMIFQIQVECPPVFQPKNYKKLPVQRKKYVVTEEAVTERIKELQEGNASLQVALQETLDKNHYVILDYQGFADNKPIKDAKGSDQLLDMSTPHAVEGLQQGLLGAKRGETREVLVQINKKPAVFRATVKEIKSKILPALDDEFAKDIGCVSLEELKTKLRTLIEEENLRKSEQETLSQIEEELLKVNPFSVPPTLVEHELERLMERVRSQILGPRRDWPDAEKEKVREKLKVQAEKNVRIAYMLRAIAGTEKIEVTPQDMESELNKNIEGAESETQKENVRKFFEEHKESIQGAVLERKVLRFLKDSASITETA